MAYQFLQPISEEIFQTKYNLYNQPDVESIILDISKEIASAEPNELRKKEWERNFYKHIISGKLIPAGRILANARPYSKMRNYNNCFTIDVEDSMEGIYNSLKEDALISKMGGGVGFDISKIRPKDAPLSKGGESSGPISFLKVFNESAKVIHTGGHRRSAHIALLDVSHPDIEEFITVKQGDTNKELTQFNISVKITDAFMEAVKKDADWELKFNGKVYKTVKAQYLYDLIAENAFLHNEPGVFYSDTIEYYNNGWWAFKLDRVNPCGEIVMPPYSLCCLSAINLAMFVKHSFTDEAYFDFEAYKETVGVGVRFLDNVLDRTEYPLKKIEEFSQQWRRIGLGITGLGDALAMLKTPYGSESAKIITDEIAHTHKVSSYQTSIDLAREKGAFPACDNEKLAKSNFIKEKLPKGMRKQIKQYGMRNIALNTIAPTGCLTKNTKIQTNQGVLSIKDIFKESNIDIDNVKNQNGQWFVPSKTIHVKTINGEKRITRLFVNGEKNVLKIKTESNSVIEGTFNHKVLVKVNEETAIWKRIDELNIGDKILKRK